MSEPLTYFYLAAAVSVAVCALLLVLIAPPQPAKSPLVVAMLLAAFWSLGDAFTNAGTTPQHVQLGVGLSMFAWAPVPFIMIRLALIYGEHHRAARSLAVNAVLLIPAVLSAFVVLTGRLHSAYLPAPLHGGFYLAEVTPWQHFINGYFLAYMVASGVLLSRAFSRTAMIEYRASARLFLRLIVPATAVGAITNGGLAFVGVQPPFLASTITSLVGVTLGIGMLREGVFAPLAAYKRQAETMIRTSEARYRTLAEISPDAVAVMTFEGRLRMVNARFAELFGFTSVSACLEWGSSAFELVVEEARPRVYRAAARTAHRDRSGPAEVQCRRVDGGALAVEVSAGVLRSSDGAPEALILTARDLSERKQAEARRRDLEVQVQRTQKLESLGVLAGGIAHDFNNILSAILGNAGLAVERLEDGETEDAIERLRTIRDAARRAASLTRQMLEYAGRSTPVLGPLDLSALVREMSSLLRVSINKKVDLSCELGDAVMGVGDASQMQQVLLNLITNAAEAIGDRPGTITLRTQTVSVGAREVRDSGTGELLPPGAYLLLEVGDTGVGMDRATQSRMFEPFFTTKFAGRGLGLAAVLGIVRSHHGVVVVDSEPGRGTRVRVYVARAGAAVDHRAEASVSTGAPRRRIVGQVLVVDDEALVREVATLALKGAGFEVLTASDGEEALELLRSCGAGLAAVVLDVTMPRLGGIEVFGRLREVHPALPVLWSSGHAERDLGGLAQAPCCGFLAKPYLPDELVEKLDGLLAAARRSQSGSRT